MSKWQGVIEQYREYLPEDLGEANVTLLEGNTPLIPVENILRELGINIRLYIKYEGLNPTASFKDRGMTVAVSAALKKGAGGVICASTGNTSASAAAYAARAGMKAVVILPAGKIALGKLSQAIIYGAQVVPVSGNFDQALAIVREIGKRPDIEIVNSINPYRIEGQKTAAFEVCDILGKAPDFHFLPVGNAGNITAYWKGYQEYQKAGKIHSLPKMLGWQAEGAAPIVHNRIVPSPETVATAIRIGNPASWQGAIEARDASGGMIDAVSDREILQAQQLLASSEGIFVEPASAASIAGIIRYKDKFPEGALVVATVTGHGLKDPDIVFQSIKLPREVEADTDTVLRAIGF